MRAFLAALIFCLSVLGTAAPAQAHDQTGKWAQLSAQGKAPPKEWWDALQSGKGLCCSFADGISIKDVDWGTECAGGQVDAQGSLACDKIHYWVSVYGQHVVVPDDAVITESNKYGAAVVWPYKDSDGTAQIRCFLPGAGA